MSFIDEITSKAMDLMKVGLDGGVGALSALSVDVVGDNSSAWLQTQILNFVYKAAIGVEELDNILIDLQTNGIGSPNLTGFNNITEVNNLKDALDGIFDPIVYSMSVRRLYRPLTTTTQPAAFTRMKKHTVDVKKNLPDVMKIAGTAGALRNATKFSGAGVSTPAPTSCSQDGAIVAAITSTPAPATSSPMDEVAGTVSSQGDVLQNASFTCADDLMLAINVASTGDPLDPDWSMEVSLAVGSNTAITGMVVYAQNPIYRVLPWVSEGIEDFRRWTIDDIDSWDVSDILAQEACAAIAVTALDDKITAERAAAGLPPTDENGLAISDPGDPTDEMDLTNSTMVGEIKEKAFMASVVGFSSNPCSQSIAARHGAPATAVVGSSVAVGSMTDTSNADNATVVEAVDVVAEVAAAEGDANIDDRKATIQQQLDTVVWAGPAFSIYLRQLKGLSEIITLSVGYSIAGSAFANISNDIPDEYLTSSPAAGESEDFNSMPNPSNTAGKNLLTWLVDLLNANADFTSNNIKIWAMQSRSTGNWTINMFAPQGIDWECTLTVSGLPAATPTETKFTGIIAEHNAVGYISDYMNSLETHTELDEFETKTLTGILP